MSPPTIFDICIPRQDVIDGTFTEADFAADLAQVLTGEAPREYRDPAAFFAQTYPTEGLKTLLRSVCSRLSGTGESIAPIFRLDTNYGGGKTHALIALAHAARGMDAVANADEFIPADHLPRGPVRVAAFDGENADPNNGRPLGDGLRAFTPWGEIANALAGREGYEMVRASDEARVAPGADTIRQLFGQQPALILLDELSVYLRKLAPGAQSRVGGQLTAFLTGLFKAVEAVPNAAVVYTLAIGKGGVARDAYREENQFIADAMEEAESVSARKATLLDPTEEDETVHVLVRRLFERMEAAQVEQVIGAYREAWDHHRALLPERSLGEHRVEAFRNGYPFHPALIETLRNKTATLGNFQRVRGMLRLLGRTVGRLWDQRPKDTYAVHLHHIDPGFEPIRQELTTRLNLRQFVPAVRADVAAVEGEEPALAQDLDERAYGGLAPYASQVARTLFVHSLAFNEQLKGASKEEVRYAVLAPTTEVSFVDDAITRFMQESAYLDDRPNVPLRFQVEANLTQIIRRQEEQVNAVEVRTQLNDRIASIFRAGRTFRTIAFPGGPYEVPDDDGEGSPYLVLVGYDAADVAADALDIPELVARIYRTHGSGGDLRKNRNNLVFLLADSARRQEMRQKMVRHLALKDLLRPERMNELAEHQQEQMRERARRSEQELALAIQQCYRHVLYPSRNRLEGAAEDLAHAAIEVPTASQTPGDGQKHVVQVLRESNKLRLPEDDPDSPSYIRDRTPLRKGQITTAALRAEFRRDPSLPILVGDDVFVRGIRQGVEAGDYVYQSGELIWAQGQPQATIKIDEQSVVYTATYAREQRVWPPPAPEPKTESASSAAAVAAGTGGQPTDTSAPPVGTGDRGEAGGAGAAPGQTIPVPLPPADVTAEGPLKEALAELWEQARSRKIGRIGQLYLKLFDPNDGFRVLGLASGVPGATKSAHIQAEYETGDGATLEMEFKGPAKDADPVRDFLDPQLRAATTKDVEVMVTLRFAEPLDLDGREPDKLGDRLGKFGGGAAYVTATAAAAPSAGDDQ